MFKTSLPHTVRLPAVFRHLSFAAFTGLCHSQRPFAQGVA